MVAELKCNDLFQLHTLLQLDENADKQCFDKEPSVKTKEDYLKSSSMFYCAQWCSGLLQIVNGKMGLFGLGWVGCGWGQGWGWGIGWRAQAF